VTHDLEIFYSRHFLLYNVHAASPTLA